MKLRFCHKALLSAGFLFYVSFAVSAQSSTLKKLEASVASARAKVEMNERKIASADSIINYGRRLLDESKTQMKAVDADSRKLEKEYSAKRKPVNKLVKSKERAEANKAKTELRALEAQYKSDNRALETRLREAEKKQTAGISNIEKSRTARKNALDALKDSENALKAAEAKYNAAAGKSDTKPDQQEKKK